jgi:hypothetical protein
MVSIGHENCLDEFAPKNHWGYASLDWSCGAKRWINKDPTKTTCEETSAANCQRLKQQGKVNRCGIYHNMELALEWLESNRAVMDQSHVQAGWFLRFPNGSVFDNKRKAHSEDDGPLMSQWFIDWRNPDAAAYFVGSIVNSTRLNGVDATFSDDAPGTTYNKLPFP